MLVAVKEHGLRKTEGAGEDVRGCNVEFLDSIMHLNGCLFDVVLNAIEERALVDDQDGKVLEEVSKLCHGCCYLTELSVTGLEMGCIWKELLGENI